MKKLAVLVVVVSVLLSCPAGLLASSGVLCKPFFLPSSVFSLQ